MSRPYKIVIPAILLYLFFPSADAFGLTDILNIRHWAAPDHTRIVIDTSEDADITVSKIPGKVSILFKNTQFPETVPSERILNKPGISKIVMSPHGAEGVNIDLVLSDSAEAYIFKLKEFQDKPFRVVIDLKLPDIEKKESEERRRFKISAKDKIIVIDAGHGGEDPGAIGLKRTMEKDVVLRIAKRLEYILNKKKGYRAFLTRRGDYYPSFRKRLQIAREYGADLFISIHADASRNRKVRGSSVYCLSTTGASSEAARLLARQENLADIIGGSENEQNSDESDPIILHMVQTETMNMSKTFGSTIIKHMKQINPIKFKRIQEAPFMVLKLPHVPSVLIETAYISNPREEMLLRSPVFQNKIALSISAAIQEFLRDPEPDNDLIHIVMEEEKEEARSASRQEAPARALPRMIVYTVKKGDTLKKIASRYNTREDILLSLNNMKKGQRLQVNRKLKIYAPPEGEMQSAEISPPAPAAAAPRPAFYIVKKGDTLEKIARKHRVALARLICANGIKSKGPLYVGRKLTIPGPAEKSGESAPGAPAPRAKKTTLYTVKKGDTLDKIARKHNTTIAALLKANRMKMKDPLYVNRKLVIPEK